MANSGPEGDQKRTREQRIEELKARARAAAGGEMFEGKMDNCPAELEEGFFDYIAAYEEAPDTTNLAQLKEAGLDLPPPDRMDDLELSAKLWQLIECLARLRVQLEDTNHLSDRELYTWLLEDGLTEETKDLAFIPGTVCHLSPIGSGSEEDTAVYLKYYADEAWRESCREEWPDSPMPEHEDPPYDRDRRLPDPHELLIDEPGSRFDSN